MTACGKTKSDLIKFTYVSFHGYEGRVCCEHNKDWRKKTLENVHFLVPSPHRVKLLINDWYGEAEAEVGRVAKNFPNLKWWRQCSGKKDELSVPTSQDQEVLIE